MALAGKTAVVQAIEQDFEDRVHVAVVFEDDPGWEVWNDADARPQVLFSA